MSKYNSIEIELNGIYKNNIKPIISELEHEVLIFRERKEDEKNLKKTAIYSTLGAIVGTIGTVAALYFVGDSFNGTGVNESIIMGGLSILVGTTSYTHLKVVQFKEKYKLKTTLDYMNRLINK